MRDEKFNAIQRSCNVYFHFRFSETTFYKRTTFLLQTVNLIGKVISLIRMKKRKYKATVPLVLMAAHTCHEVYKTFNLSKSYNYVGKEVHLSVMSYQPCFSTRSTKTMPNNIRKCQQPDSAESDDP